MTTPAWFQDLENESNSTWIQSFKRNHNLRTKPYNESQDTQYLPAVCEICRRVDFEYLFFGTSDNGGFRRSVKMHVFFGTLADVERRAAGSSGCPFCRDVLLSEAKRIRKAYAHELDYKSTGGGLASTGPKKEDELGVWLEANDFEAPRDPLQDISHGVANVKLVPALASHLDPARLRIRPGSVVEEDEEGFVKGVATGREFSLASSGTLRLVDHPLSRAASLNDSPNLQLCSSWFETCRDSHEKCGTKNLSNDNDRNTTNSAFKLIDLASRHIVEIGDATELSYATLSYVCGKSSSLWKLSQASPLWTSESTLPGRRQHPLPAELPRTISDAMTVTSNLSLRYLWVDSFCITQDNPDELQRQIRAMYQIYTRASICIVASSGTNSHSGLPGISRARLVNYRCQVKIKESLTIGLPQPSLRDLLDRYKWMNRAWTYQELILSRRCLLFTVSEVFFYCASMTCCESLRGPGHEQWARSDSLEAHHIGNANVIHDKAGSHKADELSRTYVAAVDEYSRRELPYQIDGLNAFQGLSTLLGRLIDAEMVFGCPRNMLVNCLTWQRAEVTMTDHPERRMMASPEERQSHDMHLRPLFPSWAWVAWKGHYPSPLPPTAALASIRYNFMTSDSNELVGVSQSAIRGILPVLTNIANVCVAPHSSLPFCLTVQTTNGDWAGEINIDGERVEWKDLQSQEQQVYGQCIQLFVQPSKEWTGAVCLMLIKPFSLPVSADGLFLEEKVKESLVNSGALRRAEPLTVQRMRKDVGTMSRRSAESPPEVRIKFYMEHDEAGPDVLLASRIGIGFCKMNAWVDAEPTHRIILLG